MSKTPTLESEFLRGAINALTKRIEFRQKIISAGTSGELDSRGNSYLKRTPEAVQSERRVVALLDLKTEFEGGV